MVDTTPRHEIVLPAASITREAKRAQLPAGAAVQGGGLRGTPHASFDRAEYLDHSAVAAWAAKRMSRQIPLAGLILVDDFGIETVIAPLALEQLKKHLVGPFFGSCRGG